jgi:hypothetical protein
LIAQSLQKFYGLDADFYVVVVGEFVAKEDYFRPHPLPLSKGEGSF